MKRCLLIVAHGSKREASNKEVADRARSIKTKINDQFSEVDYAFLELASPLLEQKLDELAAKKMDEIIVFPFFISAGNHVIKDIPEIVERAQQKHPTIKISITDHLGGLNNIDELIINLLS